MNHSQLHQQIKYSRVSTLLIALLLVTVWVQPATAAAAAETTAFVGVNVISMNPNRGPKIRKRQTVIVEDGEITEIGKAARVRVPAGAEIIDGKRKYLLPGLYDMHAHGDDVRNIRENFTEEDLFLLYLANGITGVYDPWGFKQIFKWQRDLERGKTLGPRLYFSSPGVNDENHSSAAAVEQSVRKWAAQGYTSIKTHSPITQEKFERLHAVARELGLPVVGHALRPGFPLQATLDQGQAMLTHVEEILSTTVDFQQPQSFQIDLAGPLASIVSSEIWVTGTVGTYDIIVKTVADDTFDALFERPEMLFLPDSVWEFWRNANIYRQSNFLQDAQFWSDLLDVKLYIVGEMERLGALDRLLLGTDSGIPLLIPGFGIHDELRLLVKAGLKPWQALLTGTYNPAVFLDTVDVAGTVEVGKRADLILVRKNPLKKIGNLKKLEGVMIDGNWMADQELDERLDSLATRWAR